MLLTKDIILIYNMYKQNILNNLLLLVTCCLSATAWAQDDTQTESLTDNLFFQTGVDLSLQKPHSYPTGDMFSKGSSLGIDVAAGKWFTPELGVRARANWENGIIDSKSEWLAPFNQPGVNHDKGGYISIHGDFLFDLHNIIHGYDSDRRWNTQLYLRAGGVYNKGTDKGAPLIGAGIGNTYKLSDRWGMYLDVAYNGVSSGFTMDPTTTTGVGTGQNMYFDVNLGVQYNFGSRSFGARGKGQYDRNTLADGSFWRNWFFQVGMDMTLYNPVEKDFSQVMPNGRSYGLDVALGKRFSCLTAVRAKLNWENGLIKNGSFEWVGYDPDKYDSNYDGGGNLMLYFDGLFSVKHLLLPCTVEETWDSYLICRMGLSSNRSIGSLSPVVGIGIGGSYRLNDRWSLFAESTYEGTTSEFFAGTSWSGPTGCAFNGIWDFNIGLQFDL